MDKTKKSKKDKKEKEVEVEEDGEKDVKSRAWPKADNQLTK